MLWLAGACSQPDSSLVLVPYTPANLADASWDVLSLIDHEPAAEGSQQVEDWAVGTAHLLVVRSGCLYGAGSGRGQLAQLRTLHQAQLVRLHLPHAVPVTQVAAGELHRCAEQPCALFAHVWP